MAKVEPTDEDLNMVSLMELSQKVGLAFAKARGEDPTQAIVKLGGVVMGHVNKGNNREAYDVLNKLSESTESFQEVADDLGL